MKRNSSDSSASNASRSRHAVRRSSTVLLAVCCLLNAGVGCESLQRKFTRKPKQPKAIPSPIISFQDYSRAMTPLDRYRKHAMMFDYWNEELMRALQSHPLNPKRYQRASAESLVELNTMQSLVTDEMATRLRPVIEERAKIDRQLQRGAIGTTQANIAWRVVESQTRQIHRDFFWRDVQDSLTPPGHAEGPSHE